MYVCVSLGECRCRKIERAGRGWGTCDVRRYLSYQLFEAIKDESNSKNRHLETDLPRNLEALL